jgi:hypothetical protein
MVGFTNVRSFTRWPIYQSLQKMASSDQRMERPIGGKRTTPENNDPI